jgi:hypothetical protein
MIGTLHISCQTHNWDFSELFALNRHNIDEIINSPGIINCCTSVEDLFCENIEQACKNAKEIILVNVDKNYIINNSNCFSYGRLFNALMRYNQKIKNFDKIDNLQNLNYLYNHRPNVDKVVWTVGCSVTYGAGVEYNARWGSLLANKLNIPEVTLSKGGSSIFWAADQILRSDIRPGDIVVWGLTNVPRVEIAKNWNFSSRTVTGYVNSPKEKQYWKLDYFESETQVLYAVRNILQVDNFCKKIGVDLYLVNLLNISWIGYLLKDLKNFIDLTLNLQIDKNNIQFIDLGTDNQHPGPKQHQLYVEQIYNFIKETNYGNQTI